jgi:hypothetical protein
MGDRLLFLDIDGVVNTIMIYTEPQNITRGTINRDGYYFELCNLSDGYVSNKQALGWVSKLCTDYKLSIVITSTWLLGEDFDEVKDVLYRSGLKKEVPVISGINTVLHCGRGIDIEHWLDVKGYDPDRTVMVILDDDRDMVGLKQDFTKYLIQTDTYVGFTYRDYIKASELIEDQIENKEG